jgi:hypothetical protein
MISGAGNLGFDYAGQKRSYLFTNLSILAYAKSLLKKLRPFQ